MRGLIVISLIILSSCATPSQRMATKLEGYGFDPNYAKCIGNYLEARLSLGQLVKLKSSVDANMSESHKLRFDELLAAGAALDPETQKTIVSSGISCAFK